MDFLLFDKKTPVMLSRHLRDLIETIGQTKNKEQEDEIIKKEITSVKTQISNGLEPQKYPDTLVKLIYFETMGYDTSFAHILPINLCQSSNIYIKKMSYLLAAMLVRPGQGVGVLMPNTILKDLQSDNHFVIIIVLTMLRYFLTDELIPQILPFIYQLKKHHISMIRRKSLLVIFNIYKKKKIFIQNIKGIVVQAINDQQSPVMFAGLSILSQLIKQNSQQYKDITKRIVQIMYGIVDHRYPKEYDYHKIPGPWFQIQILKMFEQLGKNDQATSSLLYDCIERTFRRACNFHMHFNKAIIQQCIKTISNIYPHKFLIEQSSDNLFRFFDAGNNNMKYFGIAALSELVKVNKQVVQRWQYLLLQCMDSEDVTLAEKTLSLLAQIANQENTVIILDRLIKLTQKSNDDFQRRKLIQKAILLIERFSQDRQIFLRRMNEIFYKFQRLISDQTIANYLKVIVQMSQFDESFPDLILSTYTEIISNFKNIALMKVAAWIIGQFTLTIWKRDQNIQTVDQSITTLLDNAYEYLDDSNMSFVLAISIAKLSSITTHKQEVKEYWLRLGRSKNFFLHNTGMELIRMAKYSTALYDSNNLSFQRDASFFRSYAESYTDKPKSYLITKSKASRKISYDLFELTGEETQSKKHAFQFNPNSRWGVGMGSKRISEKPVPVQSELVQKKKQYNLRGPHQEKRTKNVVDERKLKLAKSIFGVKKK